MRTVEQAAREGSVTFICGGFQDAQVTAGSRRLNYPVLFRPGLDGRQQGISALCTVLRADTPELKKLMENYKEFRIKKKKNHKSLCNLFIIYAGNNMSFGVTF